MSRLPSLDCDVVLVGGGLANSLIALQLRARRPDLSVRLLEAHAEPDDGHTWSVFRTDLPDEGWTRLSGAFVQSWPSYAVSFPRHQRVLDTAYASLTGRSLGEEVSRALGDDLMMGRVAETVAQDHVRCADGTRIDARVVIDGRGARASEHIRLAYQKFVGLELALRRPHGLTRPCIMDARVRQEDGYRFVYVLPLSADRVLIEDTRYADGPELSACELDAAVQRYARGMGWGGAQVLRREQGVLPVVLGGDLEAYLGDQPQDVPQVGMRGLFFHPTTGYSLPDAWRVAEEVAAGPLSSSADLARRLQARTRELWRSRGFYRALNRMLFAAAAPAERYRVLERFYRLPQPLIERFYAGAIRPGDKLRILAGRPPVPVLAAMAALPGDRHG